MNALVINCSPVRTGANVHCGDGIRKTLLKDKIMV
jgi:hypothetical protein